jgi:hypothetical protein
LLKRYLVIAFGSFIVGTVAITLLLTLLGHWWLVSVSMGLIWSICILLLGWGLTYVLWPVGTSRFQERLRSSYSPNLAEVGREFDRRLGFGIDPAKPAAGRARMLGIVVIAIILAAGLSSSWILLTTLDH